MQCAAFVVLRMPSSDEVRKRVWQLARQGAALGSRGSLAKKPKFIPRRRRGMVGRSSRQETSSRSAPVSRYRVRGLSAL